MEVVVVMKGAERRDRGGRRWVTGKRLVRRARDGGGRATR